MSNDERKNEDLYQQQQQQYDPFQYNQLDMNRSIFHPQPPLDPTLMSFTNFFDTSLDYNSLSRAFDVSCSSSEVICPVVDDMSKKKLVINNQSSTTQNSSVSSSSNEAVAEEDSVKSNKDDTKGCLNKDEEKSTKQYVNFF